MGSHRTCRARVYSGYEINDVNVSFRDSPRTTCVVEFFSIEGLDHWIAGSFRLLRFEIIMLTNPYRIHGTKDSVAESSKTLKILSDRRSLDKLSRLAKIPHLIAQWRQNDGNYSSGWSTLAIFSRLFASLLFPRNRLVIWIRRVVLGRVHNNLFRIPKCLVFCIKTGKNCILHKDSNRLSSKLRI